MPQMSPMNWLFLMMFILLNYLILLTYLYFNFSFYLILKIKNFKKINKILFLLNWF